MFALNKTTQRWEHRCDGCKRLLGAGLDAVLDSGAGYVLGVGKRREGVMRVPGRGCVPVFEHPLACSDACEDLLLATWPRMAAEDVYAEDWGPDFRDAEVLV